MDTARTPDPQDRDAPAGGADTEEGTVGQGVTGDGTGRAGANEDEPARDEPARDEPSRTESAPQAAAQEERRHDPQEPDDEPVFTVPVPARGSRTPAVAQTSGAVAATGAPGGVATADPSLPPPSGPPLVPAASPHGGPAAANPTPGYAPWSAPAPPTLAPPAPVSSPAPVAARPAPVAAGAVAATPVGGDEPSDAVSLWNLGLVLLGLTIGYWFFAGIRFLSYLVEVGPSDRILIETLDMVAVETVAAAVVAILAAVCLGLSRMKRDRVGGGAAFAWSVGLGVLTVLTAVWRLV